MEKWLKDYKKSRRCDGGHECPCLTRRLGEPCPAAGAAVQPHAASVDLYKESCAKCLRAQLDVYAAKPNLREVIVAAATGETDDPNVIHSHQARICKERPQALVRGALLLLDPALIELIRAAKNFEQLVGVVAAVSFRVKGLGQLWAYDTALRIAWYLTKKAKKEGRRVNLLPGRWVYVHQGAEAGRKRLNPIPPKHEHGMGLSYVKIGDFPAELRRLSAWDIENYLCLFKRHF